jgi:hypothetical protein
LFAVIEINTPDHLGNVTFVKGLPEFENPDNKPTLIVLDDLMDIAYSTSQSIIQKSVPSSQH